MTTRTSLEEFLAMPGIDERRLELIDEDAGRRTLTGDDVLEMPVVPGFSVAVGQLFDAVLRPQRREGQP